MANSGTASLGADLRVELQAEASKRIALLTGSGLETQLSDPACNGEISAEFSEKHIPSKDVFNNCSV